MTTTAPVYESRYYDENARRYLFSLRSGQKPDIRPEFGHWEPLVKDIEKRFDNLKPERRAKTMPKLLVSINQMQPRWHLSDLLVDPDTTEIPLPTKQSSMPDLPEAARKPVGLLPKVSPWLRDYLDYSKRRSPEGFKDFHLACGLWVLSTIAARRIQVELNDPLVTPLSIVLCSRTSLFAKTTTARAAKHVLKAAKLDIRLGDDETTPQRLLYDMAGHVPANYGEMDDEDQEETRYKMAMSGQLGWYYDEFNQLVDAMKRPGPMAEFAGLLRKLDNCEDEYKYSTKSGGVDKIKNPYLSFLGSTTPANLAKHASKNNEMWNDGFWARMLFVCPEPGDHITKTMKPGIVHPPEPLVNALKSWNQRLGIPGCSVTEKLDAKGKGTGHYTSEAEPLPMSTITLTDDVVDAFDAYRVALRSLVASNKMQDLDGSYARLPTLAMRIAALIASLENNNHLTLDIWSLAQEMAELFRENLHRLYAQISMPVEDTSTEDVLIGFIKTKPIEAGVTARDCVQFGPPEIRRLKTDGVRAMLVNLERSGIVSCQRQGKKECYTMLSATDDGS